MSDASGSTDTGDQGNTDTAPDAKDPTAESPDWQAEVDKWKGLSRQHEKAERAAQNELKRLQQASMSDQEKAVVEATAKGHSDALAKVAHRLVDAEVRAAAAGRGIDADVLLEGLDRPRFLGDDGEPDRESIEAYLDRLAPKSTKRLDLGQGARDGTPSNTDMNALLRRAAGR